MRKNNSNRAGFTLIELLIVAGLLGVVGAAVYSTLAHGIKIWHRVTAGIANEDVSIFFEKLSSDVRNCVKSAVYRFKGDAGEFRFPTLVNSPRMEKRTIGEVVYRYDSSAYAITREERDISHVFEDREGEVRQVMRNVRNARFTYYRYNKEKLEYEWLPDWDREELPMAVRVSLETSYSGKDEQFTKTITIPVSQ